MILKQSTNSLFKINDNCNMNKIYPKIHKIAIKNQKIKNKPIKVCSKEKDMMIFNTCNSNINYHISLRHEEGKQT